jgi:enoyl-CoA hydratase/carnithine racemase
VTDLPRSRPGNQGRIFQAQGTLIPERQDVMGYQFIRYEIDQSVATIVLNRPEALNALSHELEAELHEALDAAERDDGIRAIILTGEGRAFSSGYDIGSSDEGDPTDPAGQSATQYLSFWQQTNRGEIDNLLHIWRLRKPVIAAVNGYAMGGGFWYQLACDITIASDRAVFGQPEVRQVSSTSFLFAALVGWKVANRYALTGDHFDANEALRIGVVNEVVPHEDLMTKAMELARRIAHVPEASLRMNKAVTMLGLEAAGLNNALTLNAALNAITHASHGPDTERLAEARRARGFRGFLEERDGPFRPEPFGPKSKTTS